MSKFIGIIKTTPTDINRTRDCHVRPYTLTVMLLQDAFSWFPTEKKTSVERHEHEDE